MSVYTELINEGRAIVNHLLDFSDNILSPSQLKIAQHIDSVNKQCDMLSKKLPKGFFATVKDMMFEDQDDYDRESIATRLQELIKRLNNCSSCKCAKCVIIDETCQCSNCRGESYTLECDGVNQVRVCTQDMRFEGKTLKANQEYKTLK